MFKKHFWKNGVNAPRSRTCILRALSPSSSLLPDPSLPCSPKKQERSRVSVLDRLHALKHAQGLWWTGIGCFGEVSTRSKEQRSRPRDSQKPMVFDYQITGEWAWRRSRCGRRLSSKLSRDNHGKRHLQMEFFFSFFFQCDSTLCGD